MHLKHVCVQDGRTALHIACEKGNVQVTNSLVAKGATVNVRDKVISLWVYIPCIILSWFQGSISALICESGSLLSKESWQDWYQVERPTTKESSSDIFSQLARQLA